MPSWPPITTVFPVMTGEDTSRSHPPAGAMFRGSVSPVCIDHRNRPAAWSTANILPPSVAAMMSPPATAGEECTPLPALNRQMVFPVARSSA
jgi:hypothetical protein